MNIIFNWYMILRDIIDMYLLFNIIQYVKYIYICNDTCKETILMSHLS